MDPNGSQWIQMDPNGPQLIFEPDKRTLRPSKNHPLRLATFRRMAMASGLASMWTGVTHMAHKEQREKQHLSRLKCYTRGLSVAFCSSMWPDQTTGHEFPMISVANCCSLLLSVAFCCSVWLSVSLCDSLLLSVALCISVSLCVSLCVSDLSVSLWVSLWYENKRFYCGFA